MPAVQGLAPRHPRGVSLGGPAGWPRRWLEIHRNSHRIVLTIALTGNIASGKSTVAEVWAALGACIISADELARRAVEPGSEALRRIVERWGPGMLLPSGALDRAALRDIVFHDDEERRRLEEIVHPEVNRLRRIEMDRARERGCQLVVADIPLLFETGLDQDFALVVLVDAPEPIRHARLVGNRALPPDEAQRMIDAQWPAERKRAGSDYIIENDGSLEVLRERAQEVWARIQRTARGVEK